ncbi:tripartite tricarboxylate transporter permease [Sphaerochaeta sp. S2]|uniref:tripartite tricarboxylate transporter permease n=1 Tax=Sphaerochaeta sp. S2 TaxID=2798868 RepID=UPI0018E96D41|nr:tripartite tricarboxylate transporter permease [Sphaerochaeta sp. S2]MBJ2355320.1 tripartite tricarboxylate transporter permease [Sphaerochaeta sp. S2]
MSNWELLLQGFTVAFSFSNATAAFVGALLGILVGAMPGIGAAAGISLLLPMTFKMDPTAGIIMLAGIYYGNMYGGAYSATLLNIPGDTPAVVTAMDGYPLTLKGQAGKSLSTGNIASFIGGTIGIFFLTIFGPLLAEIGLKFGPAEVAALIFLALTSIGWLLGDDPIKGLVAACIGVLLSTIGIDGASGIARYSFGNLNLIGGIAFVPLVIGMFGFSQVLDMMADSKDFSIGGMKKLSIRESMITWAEFKQIFWPSVRSAVLGNFVGFLPGAGSTTGSFLAYILEKKIGKHRHEMGSGSINGVAVSEAANNAGAVGSFAPLLSLGIPGSASSAVLLGGLMMWGLRPGPLLFESNPDFVWGLISSMYFGNLLCLVAGMAILPFLVSFLKISKRVMIPIIMVICLVGSYSVGNSVFDMGVMIVAGIIAFYLKQHAFPTSPILLAFVLAPRLEISMRQALGISQGSVWVFFEKPISAGILICTFVLLLFPVIQKVIQAIRSRSK